LVSSPGSYFGGNVPEFHIPEQVARAVIDHAQAEYPKECCGFLVGPPGQVREMIKLTNVDPDPVMRYEADAKEMKKAYDELFDRDWEVVGIYHSHTHTPAYPSPTDVKLARDPGAVYVLVTLQDRAAPGLRAFKILEGRIEELGVVSQEIVS
jgi:[CysO sulfur-carrier protein]-S-L-cysteine hydrolase